MSKKRKVQMFCAFVSGILCLVTIFNPLPNKSNLAFAGQANHLVINKIQIDGLLGAGGTEDDWVELYNPTASSISLVGWSIQKASSNGATSSPFKEPLSGSIPAHGYYLIVRNNVVTTASLKSKADHLASDSFLLAAGNIVSLVNDNNAIQNYTDQNIVDFVGFGSAKFFEGSSAAMAIPEAKCLKRIIDGEDTDQNGTDFIIEDNPSPRNSANTTETDLAEMSGKVLLTIITPGSAATQNILSYQADIVFETNAEATAWIVYGTDNTYGNYTPENEILGNITNTITLSNLQCGTVYHYSVQASLGDESETATSSDQTFSTLACGLELNTLVMTKVAARANNLMNDGWEWRFNITVSNSEETTLKMKFGSWVGNSVLDAASNMQYSIDSGKNWIDITVNGAYPSTGVNIANIDKSVMPGRQIEIIMRMKVPVGTLAGFYTSGYGILTE